MEYKPTKNMRDVTKDELIALGEHECRHNFYLRVIIHKLFLDENDDKTEFKITLPKKVEDNQKIRDAARILASYGFYVFVYPGKYNVFGNGEVEFELWVPVSDMKWFLKDANGRSLWKGMIAI